jgi:hypothetical protein
MYRKMDFLYLNNLIITSHKHDFLCLDENPYLLKLLISKD